MTLKDEYNSNYHGLFNKKLATWAVKNMRVKDKSTKEMKPISSRSIEDVEALLKQNKVNLPDEFIYTAYYLFNMAIADYETALNTDSQRIAFVKETICDPDCCPESVLECFVTKMKLMHKPIFWEDFM